MHTGNAVKNWLQELELFILPKSIMKIIWYIGAYRGKAQNIIGPLHFSEKDPIKNTVMLKPTESKLLSNFNNNREGWLQIFASLHFIESQNSLGWKTSSKFSY